MYVAGIDAGSTATKVVLLADGRLKATAIMNTGVDIAETTSLCLEKALREARIEARNLGSVVATGYGREKVSEANKTACEISCLARGSRELAPRARTIIDIGGRDFRIIRLDESGGVVNSVVNDRCAAGTGRFLELMSEKTGVELVDFGRVWCQAREPVRLTSSCTVFIASEVEDLIARGVPKPAIIRGICDAVAGKIACASKDLGVEPPVVFVGGVSQNHGIRKALEKCFSSRIVVPPMAQFAGAYGAALEAMEALGSFEVSYVARTVDQTNG